jgi:alkanesulfonate monooxygenase SsuD/methylene tetrahydromethanopterin reductase-like flavin-dependent oxidoreductase (luciferase family)
MLADSENLVGDPYVELALAARDTTRLRLAVAVTNPVTRHPAVTASAIATLQIESGGRAVLVLGRGDSAVLQLGMRPATTAQLERAVGDVRAFLRGEDVPTATGARASMAWIAPCRSRRPVRQPRHATRTPNSWRRRTGSSLRRSSSGCAADAPEKLPPHRLRSPPRIGTPRGVGEAEAGVQWWSVEMMMDPEMWPAPRCRDVHRS